MTLAPSDDWDVTVINDLPAYKVPPVCSVPGCGRTTDIEAHHIWRRSFTGTPAAWVRLHDGTRIGNLVGLCHQHHTWVTGGIGGHKAWIKWEPVHREYEWWILKKNDWVFGGYLNPQPPRDGAKPEPPTISVPHVHEDDESCPACGKPKREKKKLPPGEKRAKSRVTITVPADERENGAEVLETLIDECRKSLREYDVPDYFILSKVLAHFLITFNASDMEGVGG